MKKIVIILIGAAAMFFVGRGCERGGGGSEKRVVIETRVDTVVVRDTVREEVPVPVVRHLVRIDTVCLPKARDLAGDTTRDTAGASAPSDSIRVSVPVERREYLTADYRAVVEGFNASLVSMEIYRQTRFVNTTRTLAPPRSRRLGFGIQAGYGITTHGPAPYIGLGIEFRFTK
jgi:hypothetical protein